jgi:hypothetical protein
MLKELWGEGIAADDKEISERIRRVSSKIADWFAEFESKNEVLVRIILDVDEYAALRLGMGDEFKACDAEKLLSQKGKYGGPKPLMFGTLWTAEVYVVRHSMEWVELTGLNGTKIQKLT